PLGATTLSLSGDGRLIATGDYNGGKVLVHDRDSGRLLHTIDPGGQHVGGVAFAPKQRLLAISGGFSHAERGHSPNFLAIWDVDHNRLVHRFKLSYSHPVFSPDAEHLAVLTGEGRIGVLEAGTGHERRRMPNPGGTSALAFSPDGRMLAFRNFEIV